VRITGTGKLRSQRAGLRHNFEHKSSKLTRRLSGTTPVSQHDAPRIKKLLGR
jgi:large subunit ribosomal protein L35